MDARRIRPLFLPPHPRRNQYIPLRRQKKLAAFRFRGLRRSRENCISAPSFFLSKTDPLRWAPILLRTTINGKNCRKGY